MANNNGLNVLDAITAAKFGNGTGGSGGVSKEYVDTQVGAVSERVDDVESVIPSAATPQNPLATASDVSGTAIPSTSTVSPVTDSADGMAQGLTIYGRSEVVDGEIKSVGEGYAIARLADLTWSYFAGSPSFFYTVISNATTTGFANGGICNKYSAETTISAADKCFTFNGNQLRIRDNDYTTVPDFVASLGDAELVYELADPSQGNAIAIKTDNGTGIDGTMAVFETALPLRGISDIVKDKLICTGDNKKVETACEEVDLGTLDWVNNTSAGLSTFCANIEQTQFYETYYLAICAKYTNNMQSGWNRLGNGEMCYGRPLVDIDHRAVVIRDDSYTDATTFKTSMSGVMLVYELAEAITTPLTDAEISAFRGLRTYANTTNITITDEPDFELDYLRNTENGQTVANVQKDLQGQIDNKITVSPLLTLTAAGWDSTTKQQTVTFAHDTSRRNVIDITIGENAAWDAAGVYAVSETTAGITFECSEMPETALTFRVTSMEVS